MFLLQTSDGSQSALPALFPAKIQAQQPPPAGLAAAVPRPMEELDLLGKALLQQALPPESQQVKWCVRLFPALAGGRTSVPTLCSGGRRDKLQPHSRVTLRELQKSNTKPVPAANATTFSSAPAVSSQADLSGFPDILSNPSLTAVDPYDSISLADVTVPLESIKPSKHKHSSWELFSAHGETRVLS